MSVARLDAVRPVFNEGIGYNSNLPAFWSVRRISVLRRVHSVLPEETNVDLHPVIPFNIRIARFVNSLFKFFFETNNPWEKSVRR